MARPAQFTNDQILDAGLDLLTTHGPTGLSITAIAKQIGAPSGSIYHRFASRDLLVAHLWLRTVAGFQDGYLAALEAPDDPLEAARAAAAHVLTWSAAHPDQVRLVMLHRSEDLLTDDWPVELVAQNKAQRRRITDALTVMAKRFGVRGDKHLRRLVFACVEVPTAEVRHCLARGTVPDRTSRQLVDETVVALLSPWTTPDTSTPRT